MAVYICKCGRQVSKSASADNTGNRDTAQCTGCPYLLPWGPDKYVEGQGFHKDVQGYECRMSPTLCYTTTYRGQASDKCTLHILSLDLDFLDTVQAWIDDHAADTLRAGFSRGSMRGTDFSDKGRYNLSISCAQNKKGMAAKAALIEQFFTGGRVRKDMTLAQEKAHILAAIREGKENASTMKYTISEHQNGLMYAYYKGRFWFWHKDQNKWVPSAFATQQYDKAKAKDSDITPEMLLDNGSFNVLEEYQVPLQRRTALEALTPADSQAPAPDDREVAKAPPAAAPASGEAPEIVDEGGAPERPAPGDVYHSTKGGQLYKIGELTNGKKTCYLTMRRNAQGGTWVPANSSVYPNLSDAQGEFEAWIRREQLEPVSPTMDAAATTDERAAKEPFKAEETSTTSASGADAGMSLPESSCKSGPNLSPAPASPADAGVAAQSLSAAGPAFLEAKNMNVSTFDFGADADTNAALMQDAQIFMAGSMARVMAAKRAHDRTANNYRGSWGKWCDLVGISRDTGDNMVRVAEQFGNIQIDGQNLIDIQPLKLLYAAAKPSAPAELVQAVKDGDITSHKQYQEVLAKLKTEQAAREKAEKDAAYYRTDSENARTAADTYHRKYEDANTRFNTLLDQQAGYIAAKQDAEARADGAEKLAEQRGTENTELKAKIRELENQPRDVAVVQPGEEQIEAWRREGADRMAATMQETVRKANDERLKAQNRVTYLQEQLANARPDADACQRTADTLYETAENLRILLRTQLKQAQLSPTAYGKVVAHVLQIARTLLDTVRVCAPDGYDMDSEEDDDFA